MSSSLKQESDDGAVIDEGFTNLSAERRNPMAEPSSVAEEILSGSAVISGKEGLLALTSKGLMMKDGKAKNKVFQENFLAWRDVICAATDPKNTNEEQHQTFILHYVQHSAKFRLRHSSVKIDLKDGHAERWISKIHEQCFKVEGRPKKVFVVINPIGGAGNARQMYHKKVAPVFECAEIHTTVVVTERSKHALEIGETQDFSHYDGIVVVGGDGLYNEVLQGLFVQTQRKAGTDYHNFEAPLARPDIPIAVIPAGTGNGLSGWYNGILDVETAALNVVRGEIHRAQIFTLHSIGKFVCLIALVYGYGAFADLIKRTDELRWMKRARYPYAIAGMVLKKRRTFNCELKFCTVKEQNSQDLATSGDGAGARADNEGWHTYNSDNKTFCGVAGFACDYVDVGDRYMPNPFGESTLLMIDTGCGSISLLKGLARLGFGRKMSTLPENLEIISDVIGIKVKLLRDETPESQEQSAAAARTRELEHLLDIDGEVVRLDSPEMELRLHTHFVPVFGREQRSDAKDKETK